MAKIQLVIIHINRQTAQKNVICSQDAELHEMYFTHPKTLLISHPNVAASTTTVKITAKINNKQHALDLAFFWYRAALLSSRSAPLVSVLVFSTLSDMMSNCCPCSLTMWATSLNSSLSSVTPCSIFLISVSRSTINESWKSTSSCEARRNCSCDCCCPIRLLPSAPGDVACSSNAVLAALADIRCFSSACRWTPWNSERLFANSRANFCWVYFCDG